MEKVESSSDWLTGCGAPLPEGGRERGRMTEQRLGCEKQLLSFSAPDEKTLHSDDRKPSAPPTADSWKCRGRITAVLSRFTLKLSEIHTE